MSHEQPRSLALSTTLPRAARTAHSDAAPQSTRAIAPTKREAVVVTITVPAHHRRRALTPRAPRLPLSSRAPCAPRLPLPSRVGRLRPGGLTGHAAHRSPSSRDGVRSNRRDAAFNDGRRFFGCSMSSSSSSSVGAPAPTPIARADRKEPTHPSSAPPVPRLHSRVPPGGCRQARACCGATRCRR